MNARSSRAAVRPQGRLLFFHRWLGLLLAPAVAYMVVTGLSLLWREQLDPLLYPQLHARSWCAHPANLDRIGEVARLAYPSGTLAQVEVGRADHGPVVVRFRDAQEVYLDACSGLVLGQRSRWGGVFGTLERLHRFRFLGLAEVSETIVGAISIALIVGVVAGLLLWARRYRGRLGQSITLSRQPNPTARALALHRLAGVIAAPVVLLALLGSLTLAFDWARTGVYRVTGSAEPLPRPRASVAGLPSIPLERLLDWVVALVPDADKVTLVLPKSATSPVEAQVVARGAPHANARTTVYLDPAADRVLRVEPYAGSSAGHKTYRWLVSLHTGAVGGWAGKLIQAGAMLALLVAAYLGASRVIRRQRPQPLSQLPGSMSLLRQEQTPRT